MSLLTINAAGRGQNGIAFVKKGSIAHAALRATLYAI
jgi:hypothetical protein